MKVRRQYIRTLTKNLLAEHEITKPFVRPEKIIHALKDKGMDVHIKEAKVEDRLSGFLLREQGKPTVIGINAGQHVYRQRFTMAHELGHLLLHPGQDLYVDDQIFRVNLRDPQSSSGENTEEVEANLFAAELLMPVDFIVQDLLKHDNLDLLDDESTEKVIHDLAARYCVSRQALNHRLSYLHYL